MSKRQNYKTFSSTTRAFNNTFKLVDQIAKSRKRAKQRKEKNELIEYSNSLNKDVVTDCSIAKIQYDSATLVAKIEFRETHEYRTIERYVTQNYVRHPIYSSTPKIKYKTIKFTLTLTSATLESLHRHPNRVISMCASEIINKLKNQINPPSWYLLKIYHENYNKEIEKLDKVKVNLKNSTDIALTEIGTHIKEYTLGKTAAEKSYAKLSKKSAKLKHRYNKHPENTKLKTKSSLYDKETEEAKVLVCGFCEKIKNLQEDAQQRKKLLDNKIEEIKQKQMSLKKELDEKVYAVHHPPKLSENL